MIGKREGPDEAPLVVELRFGGLVPPLWMQLKKQGFKLDRETLDQLQRDADAITRLKIRGILPASAARSAEKKILQHIIRILSKR